jgi:hypothetical protein
MADLSISVLKSRKINEVSPAKNNLYPLIALGVFLIAVFVIHVAVMFVHPDIDFTNEVVAFWTYEELGIQQGYVLLPLVWLVSYQQYKMEFLRLKLYTQLTVESIWRSKAIAFFLMAVSAGLTIGLSLIITFEDWIYVITIVAVSSVYQLLKN